MTTRVISKAGSVTFAALARDEARAYWLQLLQAWQQGMRRPLPLALRSGFAWLGRLGDAPPTEADELVWEAARTSYEDDDPLGKRPSERSGSPYLARAFVDFTALRADDEFAHWVCALLKPLKDAVGKPPKEAEDEGDGAGGGA